MLAHPGEKPRRLHKGAQLIGTGTLLQEEGTQASQGHLDAMERGCFSQLLVGMADKVFAPAGRPAGSGYLHGYPAGHKGLGQGADKLAVLKTGPWMVDHRVGGRTEGERGDKRIVGTFDPGEDALQEWEDRWRAVWTRQLGQIDPKFRPTDRCAEPGCTCGGKGHGVDFKELRTERDARDLGEYIAKTQDGKAPALELARGDLKSGRDGNMTPFEVLGRIGDLMGGVPEDDAAGHGWFIDSTPRDDEEFELPVGSRSAVARVGGEAEDRADLLSAVMHEMGHQLGIGHNDLPGDLMNDILPLGVRRSSAVDSVLAGWYETT